MENKHYLITEIIKSNLKEETKIEAIKLLTSKDKLTQEERVMNVINLLSVINKLKDVFDYFFPD